MSKTATAAMAAAAGFALGVAAATNCRPDGEDRADGARPSGRPADFRGHIAPAGRPVRDLRAIGFRVGGETTLVSPRKEPRAGGDADVVTVYFSAGGVPCSAWFEAAD